MKFFFTIILTFLTFVSFGQTNPKKNNKEIDTILTKLLHEIPKKERSKFIKEYKKMSPDQRKAMLALMDLFSSMPQSSKKQLIQNIDTNYNNILALKRFFYKIVPEEFDIYVEFKPPEKMFDLDESIDLWVFRRDSVTKEANIVFQEWNIELKNTKLDSLLALTNLNRNDLEQLKHHMDKANCISVSNIDNCEIGYARSGMGKYSYLIFDNPLTIEEKNQYNNGCEYIFYKDNIVLVYGGGAIGSQCFPD